MSSGTNTRSIAFSIGARLLGGIKRPVAGGFRPLSRCRCKVNWKGASKGKRCRLRPSGRCLHSLTKSGAIRAFASAHYWVRRRGDGPIQRGACGYPNTHESDDMGMAMELSGGRNEDCGTEPQGCGREVRDDVDPAGTRSNNIGRRGNSRGVICCLPPQCR